MKIVIIYNPVLKKTADTIHCTKYPRELFQCYEAVVNIRSEFTYM